MLAALLLTYVRSEWAALVAAGLIVVLASRGRASGRLVLVGGLAGHGLRSVCRRGETGQAMSARGHLGRLDSDISARARVTTPLELCHSRSPSRSVTASGLRARRAGWARRGCATRTTGT